MIGQLLNQYRLDEVVGEGGMGVVYRALDMNLQRTVAVKLLSASFREDPDFIERFHQEARIQAGLNHPNIATLFDFFAWKDMPVTVMEFIKGETLQNRLKRTGPIPAHIALPLFIQALRGVEAGHKRGIIHRDLKPSNLMITDEGIVKITDFGIAKVRSNTGHTRESTRVGSVKYMAPEQILGRPVDEKTDIYIMGGTLYEMLTGRPPFQGVSQFEIDLAHVRDRPTPPAELCPNIPPAVADAIMRALAKEPAERFATAEEFIQALPDLCGVPYVAPAINDDDATLRQQGAAIVARPALPDRSSPDETLLRPTSANPGVAQPRPAASLDETLLRRPDAPKAAAQAAHARPGTAIAIGSLLVLSIMGFLLYSARYANVGTNHGHPSPSDTATNTQQPPGPKLAAPTTRAPLPTIEVNRGLTGLWTGTYVDRSGKALLQLRNLQIEQVPGGAITGRFTYKAGVSADEECTLDKSSYSTQNKRLRLITHCRNPDHPKYLNVPLEFVNVDPEATTIEGGRLAFHLADDIVVTLKRAKGI